MSVSTATKKVGGFLSVNSCQPLGWQNCETGQGMGSAAWMGLHVAPCPSILQEQWGWGLQG